MRLTIRDHIEDAWYTLSMVWPARLAAPAVVELAAMAANVARAAGLRRLAVRAAAFGYDIADHDPADSCWGLHRRLCGWAYVGGSFRPTHAIAAERLHQRRYGEMA